MSPATAETDILSREFALRCDAAGIVRWSDARARRLFKIEPGVALRTVAARGSEEKIDRFLELPPELTPWEAVLCVDDQPSMVALLGRRDDEGNVTVVGSVVSDAYAAAMTRLGESMSEMATLHREADRRERELLRRHEELVRLHRDLEESFKGVVALHAEIGEKDDSLRRAGEVKARLVANVSHEFRTPLNSILGLTQLLLSRSDGDLTEEQETQLKFIKQSTESLYTLVNDLLDLSKMEAGKVALRTEVFTVGALFAALRGMLRPLTAGSKVQLVVEEPEGLPELETDEGKIAQILRNLISNALKFTTEGEVRVTAGVGPGGTIELRVADTGIGIAPENLHRVFEEFFQVDGPLQRNVKGTGLGLSLSRHIAGQLGGTLEVTSELGRGSTFTLSVPVRHPEVTAMVALADRGRNAEPDHQPILVVEDDRQTLFLYEKYLRGSGFHVIPARSIDEARAALRRVRPAAVVLDVMLDGETSWNFLNELKTDEATREIPTLVVTVTNREDKARALGADEFFMKPMDREWLLMKLKQLARQQPVETILVIDDDQVARYLVKKHLAGLPYDVVEAASGPEGLRLARERLPHVIFLDFVMPDMSAFDVLDELKKDPATRRIPVIIHTSKSLAEDERRRLETEATAILSKQSLSREIAIARIREALEKAGIRSSRTHGERHG